MTCLVRQEARLVDMDWTGSSVSPVFLSVEQEVEAGERAGSSAVESFLGRCPDEQPG